MKVIAFFLRQLRSYRTYGRNETMSTNGLVTKDSANHNEEMREIISDRNLGMFNLGWLVLL